MKPPKFMYCDPDSVEEAVALKSRYGHDSLVLAGGQSLMPMLNMRLANPDVLIDINRVAALQQITRDGDVLEVGAGVRQSVLETDPAVAAAVPLLGLAIPFIGHIENRHRGTVGGSLAHADSAAELPTAAITLDAEMVIEGPAGRRGEAAADFFAGWMTTTVAPDELLVAVRFPIAAADAGWGFVEVARREGDFALSAAGAQLRLDAAGRISEIAIGVASITDRPVRAAETEAQLLGQVPTPEAVAAAARAVEDQVTASDDMHATHTYRRHLAATVTQRAVLAAVGRAQEGARQ
jgi:carbon-monoxide dehydrogenase medium subunit